MLHTGFHATFDKFVESLGPMPAKQAKARSIDLLNYKHVAALSQRIAMRAGSVVIWDQRCAHGSRPNHSSNTRAAAFFRMLPAGDFDVKRAHRRAKAVARLVEHSGVAVTAVGEQVFGMAHLKRRATGSGTGVGGGGDAAGGAGGGAGAAAAGTD